MAQLFVPTIDTLLGLARIVAVGFFVYGGINVITSSDNPEKMAHAKRIVCNAL